MTVNLMANADEIGPTAWFPGSRLRAPRNDAERCPLPPQNTWMNLLTPTFSGSVPVVTEKSMNF
jgi:hypothetical protein